MGLITHPHTSHNQSNWGITFWFWYHFFFFKRTMYSFVFLFDSRGQGRGTPELIKGLFLPSFKFIFLHTKIVTCVLGYYLNIWKSVPFNVHINENESMNAQWVLSPLSLSFSLTFSSPLSTAIAVPTLLQIPLQPFNSINSIMGS